LTYIVHQSARQDLGKDEPGMTLQYRDAERGYIVWRDYMVDGEAVISHLLILMNYRLVGIG
jgi:hypothetical protein